MKRRLTRLRDLPRNRPARLRGSRDANRRAQRFRAERLRLRLTQRQAAAALGVHTLTVIRWEQGLYPKSIIPALERLSLLPQKRRLPPL